MAKQHLTDFSINAILELSVRNDVAKERSTEESILTEDVLKHDDGEHSPPDRRKKTRTVFTRQQVQKLENAFGRKKYFTNTERQKLAADLLLSETQVKIWLQNRRNKWKKQLGQDTTSLHPYHHSLLPPDITSNFQTKFKTAIVSGSEFPMYGGEGHHKIILQQDYI